MTFHFGRNLALTKQPRDKGITKDKLIGMKVVDSKGYIVGTVKDIGFTVGKVGISLNIEDQKGEVKDVSWEEVQAAGDFVLLKPTVEAGSSGNAITKLLFVES